MQRMLAGAAVAPKDGPGSGEPGSSTSSPIKAHCFETEALAPEPPPEYVCPISQELMRFPVTLVSTGQV